MYGAVRLSQFFGWTPAQIKELTAAEWRDYFAVIAAQQTYNGKVEWFP